MDWPPHVDKPTARQVWDSLCREYGTDRWSIAIARSVLAVWAKDVFCRGEQSYTWESLEHACGQQCGTIHRAYERGYSRPVIRRLAMQSFREWVARQQRGGDA